MMIAGFILAHFCLLLVLLGVIMPRYYDMFIPPHRREEGTEVTVASQPKGLEGLQENGASEFNLEYQNPTQMERALMKGNNVPPPSYETSPPVK